MGKGRNISCKNGRAHRRNSVHSHFRDRRNVIKRWRKSNGMQLPSTGVVDDLYGRFFCAPRTRNHVFICHRALRGREGTDTRARTRLRPSTNRATETIPCAQLCFRLLGNSPSLQQLQACFGCLDVLRIGSGKPSEERGRESL